MEDMCYERILGMLSGNYASLQSRRHTGGEREPPVCSRDRECWSVRRGRVRLPSGDVAVTALTVPNNFPLSFPLPLSVPRAPRRSSNSNKMKAQYITAYYRWGNRQRPPLILSIRVWPFAVLRIKSSYHQQAFLVHRVTGNKHL